ncbi:MAG: serine hydrolase domain-containing protein, partial [Anaerolineae bacterium]
MHLLSARSALLLALAAAVLTVALGGPSAAEAMPTGPGGATGASLGPAPDVAHFGDSLADISRDVPDVRGDQLSPEEFDAWLAAVKESVAADRAATGPATAPAADAAAPSRLDQGEDDELWATIDACMEADMIGDPQDTTDDTPGAAIAIIKDDEYAYRKGYGVKHLEDGGEIDDETLFRIGSTTKMMTAAAVMQLREQELVDLDAPLATYLPDFGLAAPWSADDVTLHHLLSHTSGIPDNYYISDVNISLLDWVPSWNQFPLYAAPGSFWNYSNPNFSLAGAVVETISQMPYADYMEQQIYEPAGLPLTTLKPTDVISHANYATGHSGDSRLTPTDEYYPVVAPAGYAWSTPTEMVKWAMILGIDSTSILEPESAFLMQERQAPLGTRPWADYGYGIFITDYRDVDDPEYFVTVYDHGGNTTGFSSQLFWIPERGFAVSILANTIRSLSSAAQCAVREVAGLEPIPTDDLGTGPEEWVDLVGTYSMLDVAMWPFTANVRLDVDTLMLDFTDVDGDALVLGDEMLLQNAYLDVFVADAQPFLLPGGFDLTFLRDPDDDTRVRYMRNRNVVGQRVGQFPPRVVVEGEGCADVAMTAELDMADLEISAAGLTEPLVLTGAPISQDDQEDYSTASYKNSFTVEGTLDFFYARLL